jgi:hypothetical protein
MAKRFHFSAAFFFGLSAGLVSPAASKMSDTRFAIGVQVVEPCTISLERGAHSPAYDHSAVVCARDRAASLRTIRDASVGSDVASVSTRSETAAGRNKMPHYDVTEVSF